MHVSGEK